LRAGWSIPPWACGQGHRHRPPGPADTIGFVAKELPAARGPPKWAGVPLEHRAESASDRRNREKDAVLRSRRGRDVVEAHHPLRDEWNGHRALCVDEAQAPRGHAAPTSGRADPQCHAGEVGRPLDPGSRGAGEIPRSRGAGAAFSSCAGGARDRHAQRRRSESVESHARRGRDGAVGAPS